MKEIEAAFNEMFHEYGIRLPPEDIAQRRSGRIVQAGWAIWYLFGSDDKGEYLDFYSSHRMCGDRHARIFEDGTNEDFPAIISSVPISRDPEENARLRAEFYARNERVAQMLAAKGFGMRGGEPGGVQVNRALIMRNPNDGKDQG